MVDWAKRVSSTRAADVAGETVLAATYFQGRGSASAQIVFGALRSFGDVNLDQEAAMRQEQILSQAHEGYRIFPGSIADRFPDAKGVIAVTDRSLIVFGYHQGVFTTRIEDPVVRVSRDDIVGWSYSKGAMASLLNLAFRDDSSIGIELPMANKPAEFARKLGIPASD